jgi:hypothetical protein
MYLNDNGKVVGAWKTHPEDKPITEKTWCWLFMDYETGTEFIVQITKKWNFLEEPEPNVTDEMYIIAQTYFEDVEWLDEITEEEADRLGLDTYTE